MIQMYLFQFMIPSILHLLLSLTNMTDLRYEALKLLGDVWSRNQEIFDRLKPLLIIDPHKDDLEWQKSKISLIKRICWEGYEFISI